MSHDLLLTPNGDITFNSSNTKSNTESLTINFYVAPSNTLQYNFSLIDTIESKPINAIMSSVDVCINTEEEIYDIEKPYIGMKFYIKELDKRFVVTELQSIMPLNLEYEDYDNVYIIQDYKELLLSGTLELDSYIYTPKFDKRCTIVSDSEYIEQAIRIRLSTELETVRENMDLGTDMYTLYHSNLKANKLELAIKNRVYDAIKDILPNSNIDVRISKSDYLNYHDSIEIVIINNDKTFYYYV
jgi:hypothetical protein